MIPNVGPLTLLCGLTACATLMLAHWSRPAQQHVRAFFSPSFFLSFRASKSHATLRCSTSSFSLFQHLKFHYFNAKSMQNRDRRHSDKIKTQIILQDWTKVHDLTRMHACTCARASSNSWLRPGACGHVTRDFELCTHMHRMTSSSICIVPVRRSQVRCRFLDLAGSRSRPGVLR